MLSNDPERVLAAMTRADKAIRINPNIMDGVEGGAELETSVVRFRTLRKEMSEEQAAKEMIRERTLELQGEPQR